MWVFIAVGIGLVAVVIAAVLVTRETRNATSPTEISPEDLFSLGVVFTGAGVAMTATLGSFMVWMIGLGVIYMAMGTQKKRHQ
jgi:hypothetical protein